MASGRGTLAPVSDLATSRAPRALLHVRGDGDTIILAVEGPLDGQSGELLLSAVSSAPAGDTSRLEIDLGEITSYDADGAGALGRCRAVAEGLPCRVSYRAGSRMGRQLLLETLRRVG